MDYLKVSDYLWYLGHILSGFAIIVNRYSYSGAVIMILSGQDITMISRPIGRIKNDEEKNVT